MQEEITILVTQFEYYILISVVLRRRRTYL